MVLLGVLIFVAAGGLVYLLLRILPLDDTQRRFLMVAALTSLFLILAFGSHAREAVIALLILGIGGLLALERVAKEGYVSDES